MVSNCFGKIDMTTSNTKRCERLGTFNPQTFEEVKADFAAGKTLPQREDQDVEVMARRFERMGLPQSDFDKICKEAGL